MASAPARRDPRAHWVLVGLILATLLAVLCFHGYADNAGGDGSGKPVASPGGPAPEALVSGGPVLRISASGAQSVRLPAKTIALTFDDGPDPRWTPQILSVLRHYHAQATFFEIGSKVNEHPDLARQVVAAGSGVGVHTFTHPDMDRAPEWRRRLELTLTANAIAGAAGVTPTLMRPPYSSTPAALTTVDLTAMRTDAAAGYLVVLSDVDAEDWRRPGVRAIVANSTPTGGNGAIVLMHDGGGDRAQTVAALSVLIPRLQAQGYRFVTVTRALGLPGDGPASAAARWRGVALRYTQDAGAIAAQVMTWLLVLALILGLGRLPVQVAFAGTHARRQRRLARRPLKYLGGVSVIVPAYNEAANIAATVMSLVHSDYPQFEVIVVDDGSTDGTADIVRSMRLPGVQVIRQANAGKPAALNTGIAAARYDTLVLVDGDTIFDRDALGRLVQPLADPAVGAVSGNTKVANRTRLLGRWQHLEYVIGFNLDRRMFDLARCMPTIPGAIGAFRRVALAEIGGVSDQTLAEDTDLTMAVARCGWRTIYQPDAIARTEVPSTLRQLWRQRYRWCYGTLQAMWKHRRSLIEHGLAGQLGRRGLGYLLIFQVLLPLVAPTVDIYAVYGVIFLPFARVMAVWLGFVVLQMLTAWYALRLDGEPGGAVWSLPLQQFVYRQMMYLVVVQSAVMALLGGRLRWHRMNRTGAAAALAGVAPPPSRGGAAPRVSSAPRR